ncbi:hypothetical protein CFP56_002134 [Quercus suber]|uniref:Uncharacterized protein n=1 Tax=Quercus suber TaxID=58331 RepID=A0AAW0M938_QUESU
MEYTTSKQISRDKDNSKVKVRVLGTWDARTNQFKQLCGEIKGHSLIQVQVQYETGSTTFILFNKGAEKIISKTTKELAEMQEEHTYFSQDMMHYGKENYTVSKILEMEISHKQNDSHKVEEHRDIMEEIVRKSRKEKYIANQKIEIGETSIERPELTAPITTEDGRPGISFKNLSQQTD